MHFSYKKGKLLPKWNSKPLNRDYSVHEKAENSRPYMYSDMHQSLKSSRWSLADKPSAWLGWATCRQSIFSGNSGILIMSPIMIKKFNVFNFVIGKDDELLLWGPLWFKSVFYFVIGKGRLYWSFHWNIHIQQQYIFSEHLAVPSIDNTRQYCYL